MRQLTLQPMGKQFTLPYFRDTKEIENSLHNKHRQITIKDVYKKKKKSDVL